MSTNEDHTKVHWKAGEDIHKWIFQVETYAAACGWDKSKTAGKAAFYLEYN